MVLPAYSVSGNFRGTIQGKLRVLNQLIVSLRPSLAGETKRTSVPAINQPTAKRTEVKMDDVDEGEEEGEEIEEDDSDDVGCHPKNLKRNC